MRASATPSGPTGRRCCAGFRGFALLTLLSLSACFDSQPAGGGLDCDARPVRMGVASSLREIAEGVTNQLTENRPAIQIESIFGASSTHARQLRLGAPFDVLISADADLMTALAEGDWIDLPSIREIARGSLILVGRVSVQTDASSFPAKPKPLSDREGSQSERPVSAALFLREKIKRIAVPSEVVPLGRYARAWLRGQNLLESLEGKLVTTEHARANLSAVESGHVDLAFAYASDHRLLRGARFLGELDAKDYPPIRYVAARTRRAARCANAEAVLETWSHPSTRYALAEAGFSPPQNRPKRGGLEP